MEDYEDDGSYHGSWVDFPSPDFKGQAAWEVVFTDYRPDDLPYSCCRHHYYVDIGNRCS